MPSVETIIDDSGKSMNIINIDNAVGAKGVNHPSDVRIIKALFQYVPKEYRKGKTVSAFETLGLNSSWNVDRDTLPSAHDGTMWGVVELTKSFQRYAHKMLSNYGYRVNVSGTIKPSKGYALTGKNYSTIAALNLFASLGARRFNKSYIERIAASCNGAFEYLLDDDENATYSDD